MGWNRASVVDLVWNDTAPSPMDHLLDGADTFHGNNVEER